MVDSYEEMCQLRVNGRVVAEYSEDGVLHVYPENTEDDVEVWPGWPGT